MESSDSLLERLLLQDGADMWLYFHLLLLAYGAFLFYPAERNPSTFEQRLRWEDYSKKHSSKGTFRIRLRMTEHSFNKLLSFIHDDLIVNEMQANPRGGPIIPELCLFCTLRWLAGGSYLDICDIAGLSKPSFYRVLWKTIKAIVRCKEEYLRIKFPSTESEMQVAMEGMTSISFMAAIQNCIGVVDGYIMRLRVPSSKEVGNVKSYFSGHYQCHGANVQAVADHHSRFIYLAFAAPGVANDRDAIHHCGLDELVENLPFGVCIIGDIAYEATEHMVPVYGGVDKMNPFCDNFNYYASQVRIRVEMAFGLMQIKWGILQHPIGCKISNAKWLLQAIGRLHNFVINERLEANGITARPVEPSDGPAPYLPSVPHDEAGNVIDLNAITNPSLQRSYSELREVMARRVQRLQLERPAANRLKRKRDDFLLNDE